VFLAAVARRADELPAEGLIRLATLGVLAPIAIGLARSVVQRTRQRADAECLEELAAMPPDLAAPVDARAVEALAPIELREVSFRFPPPLRLASAAPREASAQTEPSASPLVFERVTVRWSGEGALAIQGANGSGKSTLLALLLRLVDPNDGEVRVGGVDLRSADLAALRRRVAYVAQRPLLLEGMTVGEAMRMVAPEADDERLLSALERVGLATRLRARASNPLAMPCASLSVGEVQRVAIARAVCRDAELLVLDEPEAGLDPKARGELRALLESLVDEGKRVVLACQHDDVVPEGAARLRLPLAAGNEMELGAREPSATPGP
jgi:ABC-type multidrug transport system fused ATPase/permease subunit